MGAAYAAVLVGTATCGCAAGTLGGFAAALLLAALLAAAALACPPGRWRGAAGWAAGALLVALVPASLAAEAAGAARRGADATSALAALPPGGLTLAEADLAAPAVLLRQVAVRLDLMGEGVALWPMCDPLGERRACVLRRPFRGFSCLRLHASPHARFRPAAWAAARRRRCRGSGAA